MREELRFLRTVRALKPALCLVLTDRPRLAYRLAGRWTRVVFFVQDVTHTCPGDPPHRYLKVSRSACARPAGLPCLGVDRVEGCLGDRVWWRKLYRIAHSALSARLLSGIDTIVTQSSFSEALVRRGLSRSARVIVHPRIHRAAPATGLPDKPEEARRLLGFVGRVETYKGILEAIEILALLPEIYCLQIIGSGGAEPEARRLVRERGLERRVAFIGWLERAEAARAVAACGVVLVPSLWAEAFGMVGPEALFLGTPVVAYGVGGVPEWCDGALARAVPLGDRVAAARAVVDITGDPERWKQLCHEARDFGQLQFGESTSRERLLAILDVSAPAMP
jgi:glycosyltransferase involved in cell wall biosynthesis